MHALLGHVWAWVCYSAAGVHLVAVTIDSCWPRVQASRCVPVRVARFLQYAYLGAPTLGPFLVPIG